MTRIIQNLRIGTKLAIASALCILLVGLMIFSQMTGNAAVRKANESAIAQQTVARDAIDRDGHHLRILVDGDRDIGLSSAAREQHQTSKSNEEGTHFTLASDEPCLSRRGSPSPGAHYARNPAHVPVARSGNVNGRQGAIKAPQGANPAGSASRFQVRAS